MDRDRVINALDDVLCIFWCIDGQLSTGCSAFNSLFLIFNLVRSLILVLDRTRHSHLVNTKLCGTFQTLIGKTLISYIFSASVLKDVMITIIILFESSGQLIWQRQ